MTAQVDTNCFFQSQLQVRNFHLEYKIQLSLTWSDLDSNQTSYPGYTEHPLLQGLLPRLQVH